MRILISGLIILEGIAMGVGVIKKGKMQKELFQRFFSKFILIRMLRLNMIYQFTCCHFFEFSCIPLHFTERR